MFGPFCKKYISLNRCFSGDSWDEWVGAERLMKTTEENIRKQQALDKKQGVEPKSARSNQAKSIKANGILSLSHTINYYYL